MAEQNGAAPAAKSTTTKAPASNSELSGIDLFKTSAPDTGSIEGVTSNDELEMDLFGGEVGDDGIPDLEEGSDEEVGEEDESKKDTEDDVDSEAKVKEEEEKKAQALSSAKKVKVKVGDKEFDLSLDAEIPVKVNGEMKSAKISELQAAFSSKSAMAEEVRGLKEQKVKFDVEKSKLATEIEDREIDIADKEEDFGYLSQAVKKGDVETAITTAAVMAGVNPADFWDQIDEIMGAHYIQVAKLTPSERKNLQLDRRNKLRDLHEGYKSEKNAKRGAVNDFRNFKKVITEKAGVTNDEVHAAWLTLEKRARDGELTEAQIASIKKLNEKGKYQVAVAEALAHKQQSRIKEVINTRFSHLQSSTSKIIAEIEDNIPGEKIIKMTNKQLEEIINSTYNGNKGSQSKSDATISKANKLSDKATPRHVVKLETAPTDEDDFNVDSVYEQETSKSASQVWGAAFSKNLG